MFFGDTVSVIVFIWLCHWEEHMRTTSMVLTTVSLAAIIAIGSTAPGLAQMKEGVRPGGVTNPVVKRPPTNEQLSNQECLGLGGDVHTTTGGECASGKYCQTTTISKAGVKHVNIQCITEMK
jgi:hypothetical protein